MCDSEILYLFCKNKNEICASVCVIVCVLTHIHERVRVGGGHWVGEHSSVWLNQTFLLSLTMMSDGE